ncbi:hypothetical protein LCGC14_0414440 [marine sediment metagenome]|uniref:Uncharacterized protein n=1 Tax=marine sediment metagenome TaxID=412755 RepID=A0A0F9SYM3_9ZZZZ
MTQRIKDAFAGAIKTGYAPDMTSKSRRAARAMLWSWFENSWNRRDLDVSLTHCLEYIEYASEEEKDALIVARALKDNKAAADISDRILERYRDES